MKDNVVDSYDSASTNNIDPYNHLKIRMNKDGTLTRLHKPSSEAEPTPWVGSVVHHEKVLSKDIWINAWNKTWVRVYVPGQNASLGKLPCMVAFHGGGFIAFSAGSTEGDVLYGTMASELGAVIVSVDYRLAPEHRLPAAYEDAVDVLHWVKTTKDEWFLKHVDYGQCYLMGNSAGGNIAYMAGLRVAQGRVGDLDPLKIKGLILHQPFFGGTRRTKSELRLVNDFILPLSACDLLWELSLPVGADRDHEYCNPMANGGSHVLDNIKTFGWKILVVGCGGDPLVDRQIEFVDMLRAKGVNVSDHFTDADFHAVEYVDPQRCREFIGVYKNFMLDH